MIHFNLVNIVKVIFNYNFSSQDMITNLHISQQQSQQQQQQQQQHIQNRQRAGLARDPGTHSVCKG